MNIRDFEYLIAVDELKSFVKASKKCFISQPALSQKIKKIEDQLGFDIFERDKRQTITTTKGTKVIQYAKKIINSYESIKEIGVNNKELKVALIPTICSYLLPHIIGPLQSRFPNIKFYFLESKTEELLKKLQDGDIDVGIVAHFKGIQGDKMKYLKLYHEEFLLALPKDSQLSSKDFPKIVEDKELILLEEGNCMSDNIKDICSIYNTQNSFSDFYATNIETVKNMIKINNGAALLPEMACLDEDNLKIIPLRPEKYREVGMVYRKNFDYEELVKSVGELIAKNCPKYDNKCEFDDF